MAKDPAFLFYPNDWMGGTMGMSFEEKGAYIELLMMQFNRGHMTKHMMGQVVGQLLDKVLDKFTKDSDGLYFNERLELEQEKRKSYVASRLNNKKGKNQHKKEEPTAGHTSGHMTSHMVNENVNTVVGIKKVEIQKKSTPDFLTLYEKMMAVFIETSPTYFKDDTIDYPACSIMANKIEELKGWEKGASMNGKEKDFLEYWREMSVRASKHNWLSQMSLKDLSVREWQKWCKHMSNIENGTSSSDKKPKAEKKETAMADGRLIASKMGY